MSDPMPQLKHLTSKKNSIEPEQSEMLDTEGTKLRTDGGLLRSAPARRPRAEAEAMAEQALRMMGFFSPEEHDKINIQQENKSRKKDNDHWTASLFDPANEAFAPAKKTAEDNSSPRGESRDSLEDEGVSGSGSGAVTTGTGKDSKHGAEAPSGSVASAGGRQVGREAAADGNATQPATAEEEFAQEYKAIAAANRQTDIPMPDSSGVHASITAGISKILDLRRTVRKIQQQQAPDQSQQKALAAKQAYLEQQAAKTPEQKAADIEEAADVITLALGDDFIPSQGAAPPDKT